MLKFVNNNELISENQIGFREKSRTSDHVFTLKSIIDHYKTKKKKVFAAFIDLRKAFDTVWREGLFYSLLNMNVPRKIFNMIYSMYQDTQCKIKFTCGISETFPSTCGVKQGDVLSPLLFNLFINGIVEKLRTANSDPVVIGNLSINSLLYADDIILLSSSQEGLQESLNGLQDFCNTWKLDVNIDKSKVIVFNSNGKTYSNTFMYNGSTLETVKTYCYLGMTIKYTGNMHLAGTSLMEKARKAWFKIKKSIGLDNPCNLLEKLFNSLVEPILLYGSEIWGVQTNPKDSDITERFHLKFIKEILGVHSKASNAACRGELHRLPLSSKIYTSALNFLEHIASSSNSLVNKIFIETENSNPWIKSIKSIINKLGFSYINSNLSSMRNNLKQIKQRIIDQSIQSQTSAVSSSSKLKFYNEIYSSGTRPKYVDLLKFKSDRATICKMKVSAHMLEVERGRYQNISRENRLCNSCNEGLVEDEMHFLFHCTAYNDERDNFFKKLGNLYPNTVFSPLHIDFIFNNESAATLKILAKFINECLEKRQV